MSIAWSHSPGPSLAQGISRLSLRCGGTTLAQGPNLREKTGAAVSHWAVWSLHSVPVGLLFRTTVSWWISGKLPSSAELWELREHRCQCGSLRAFTLVAEPTGSCYLARKAGPQRVSFSESDLEDATWWFTIPKFRIRSR